MTQPADLTAVLEEIKARSEFCNAYVSVLHGPYSPEQVVGRNAASAADVPRLLAVADAVLDLHKPGRVTIVGALCPEHENHRFFSITRTEAADVAACPDCAGAVYETCAGCGTSARLDRCPTREAVSRALGIGQISSGEEGADHA
jgi:hypothetical protein